MLGLVEICPECSTVETMLSARCAHSMTHAVSTTRTYMSSDAKRIPVIDCRESVSEEGYR